MNQPVERRLAAILAADVAGYSRLMGEDEAGTAQTLREHRAAADPLTAQHGGRIVKTTGDGVLIEFGSVVGAVQCAVGLQKLAAEHNAGSPPERRMEWRIGVHLGDVLIEGDDILGDGVNIAARLEGIAEPGGICISDDAYRQVRGKIEAEFADIGEQSLKNIARPLRVYRIGPSLATEQPTTPPPPLPLPDKPSVAVLPFVNMSGDLEQEYFADGMVEEIITALSRIRWLFVIARNSSFTYKGQAVDVKEVGRELGVRYVLEGSVRKAEGRVRITAQLIDALSGAHLWADRFDGSLEDIFDLQDKVAVSVAGVIEPALQAAETARSVERPTQDLTAYDFYLRAARMATISAEGARLREAAALLQQAIARDPLYGPALGTAAVIRIQMDAAGATDDPARNQAEAIALARRGLEVAPDDPAVLRCAGFALGYFGEDISAAITLVDRSLALNPSNARAWRSSGILRVYAGDLDLGIEHLERSIRLDPRANMAVPLSIIGVAHFFAQRFDLAIPKLLAATQHMPSYRTPYRFLTACYAHLGQLAEAREILARLRGMSAGSEPRVAHWRKPEHQELLLSGLRLAAGETT
jgi:adenylate cyclase